MAYFDVSKLNLVYTNVMKAFKSKMQWCRRDTVVLRTTCVKNVKFKIIKKDRLSIFGILSPQRKPQLGRTKPLTGPHAARGLDIAVLRLLEKFQVRFGHFQESKPCIAFIANPFNVNVSMMAVQLANHLLQACLL